MISDKYSVSVVLPSAHNISDLEKCIYAILEQTYMPKEILVVDSLVLSDVDKKQLLEICQKKCTLNIISCDGVTNPGAARNIGVKKANGDYIAFVDVMTIPRNNWLRDSLKEIDARGDIDILWGATVYAAGEGVSSYIRDAIYGANQIRTIPGSAIKKKVFDKVGDFLEDVRAGEDSEWMRRSQYFGLVSLDSKIISTDYYGLLKISLLGIMKKWLISYHASGVLDFYKWQKHFIFLILFPYFLFMAYVWNDVFTGWQESSILYIPHITKIVSTIPLVVYLFYRGILLPYSRGVSMFPDIIPFRFVILFLIGITLDVVKFYAFITMPKKKKTSD